MEQNLDRNIVIFDWLTFSAKNKSVDDMKYMLAMGHVDWEECPGRNFYRSGVTFHGVSIWYDGIRDNMGVCVNMSGQGCRAFESHGHGSWESLIHLLISDPFTYNISRLDAAYDDHTGILDIEQLRSDVDSRYYVCRSTQWEVQYGSEGTTIYFGSEKSDIMLRIYDKAAERGLDDTHWIRVELQLRRDRAKHFALNVFKHDFDIGKVFSGVLVGYLAFKTPDGDSNRSRWPVADYWLDLLGDLEEISYWESPAEEYNAGKLKKIVDTMYGNGIYTFIHLYGISGLLKTLYGRPRDLNDNYLKLLRDQPSDLHDGVSDELSKLLEFLGINLEDLADE